MYSDKQRDIDTRYTDTYTYKTDSYRHIQLPATIHSYTDTYTDKQIATDTHTATKNNTQLHRYVH